ncbi:MAG TPA: lysophospholipid acyltransferase family protein, partial [Acidimicrobiia bacterium]|nr:lysophospholipid acyltransferase family protein [Acidimicrobiia bacterium]
MRRFAWWVVFPTIKVVAKLAWRLRIDRPADFPDPPFVVAANHHSFLDPALVGAAYGKRQRFFALADLFGNYRLLDWILRTFEVIEVSRGTVPLGPLRQALRHLEEGGVVGVFPEGTRAWRFGDVSPRPGAAWLAVRTETPLVPVAVIGSER